MGSTKSASKRVAVCNRGGWSVCNRKAYQALTHCKQVNAARLLQATKAGEVRPKLAHLEGLLNAFEEEVFVAGMVGIHLVFERPNGPSEERLLSDGRIAELEHEIERVVQHLRNHIDALRRSEEISDKKRYPFTRQLTRLEERYIDSGLIYDNLPPTLHCNIT